MTWTPDPGMTPKQIEKELNRQAVLFEEQCAKNAEAAGHMKFESYAKRWLTEVAPSYLAPPYH